MALKRLPNDVQSLLCASARVNSYKRAIEELIYNSLDAKSTSIAIRIHIQESAIQVIDNGMGITKHDFNVIGQRYMTSKVTDVATLKAAPKYYGFRGEFLANLITISHMVKVTSRHESTEDTWAKTFINGKENKFNELTTRPTKGTTVDIRGFLSNLNIQKRGIDSINELQIIKSFLEQLSLVHNHISLSLRDDTQNEIVFKIHKKRDIYQTLSTLFNIDKLDVVELQVEKDEYRVKGHIGKADKNLDVHWIYLNGKFMHNCSKVHKILNEYFKKSLHIKDQRTLKFKKQCNDEHLLFGQNIPFYFVFISCPYIDYDISYTPKQSIIEFKKWEQIKKLLEKLINFYAGDVNTKVFKKVEDKEVHNLQTNNKLNQDTRDQVKKIMNKILGSHSKKLGVSQLQNGIKGKRIKRKVKKKTNRGAIISKLIFQNDNICNNNNHTSTKSKAEFISVKDIYEKHVIQEAVNDSDIRKEHKALENLCTYRNNKKQTKIHGPKKYKTKEIPKYKKKTQLKSNILLPEKKENINTVKQNHKLNKQKKTKVTNSEFNMKNTDSVCKKSKIVAKKIEKYLQKHTKERNINIVHQLEDAISKCKKNTLFVGNKRNTSNSNNLLPLKISNKYMIEKYIMNKLKKNSHKTTYDLVQTILNSQDVFDIVKNNSTEETHNHYRRINDTLRYISKVPKQYTWTNKYICNEYSGNNARKEGYNHTTDISLKYKTHVSEEKFSFYEQNNNVSNNIMTNVSEEIELINKEENIHSRNQNLYCLQNETSYHTMSDPLKVLTYNSHRYHENEVLKFIRNDTEYCSPNNNNQNIRFITKESRDNFIVFNDVKNRLKKSLKTAVKNETKILDMRMVQITDESLYTIEYSNSSKNNYNTAHTSILPKRADSNKEKSYYKHTIDYEPIITNTDLNLAFGNTYTIHPSNSSLNENITSENQMQKGQNIQPTIQFETNSVHDSYSEVNDDINKCTTKDLAHNSKNFNIVFVSKSQRSGTDTLLHNNTIIEPVNVCETVFDEIGSGEKEFAVSFNENDRLNDSLYGNFRNFDGGFDQHVETENAMINQDNEDLITENISHHFICAAKPMQNFNDDDFQDSMQMEKNQNIITKNPTNIATVSNFNPETIDCNFVVNFNLKNRPRFMPKGMSQIFENCRTKIVSDYNMEEDYFEDSIYNNFANDVQVNSEIYKPIIQNVEDLTTKDFNKFQNKVKKDNASLVFDERSLKNAKVLGQADCKFIAAIMTKRCSQSTKASEYLILFDQHAVHERIRLEKNLADYLNEYTWTSVSVDIIILKMSKDEILYLHNYKDKFTQFGLQWTILDDNQVAVHSIPEAILGKHPREVEKVIKAVRNLIIEEINVIKSQKGCVSLYPKSIMDLVFSESCRYAIKFGDPLSKSDCVELLNALSNCKTPFQCAHGRPVMAVIMDIITDKREYKVNMEAVRRFRQRIGRYVLNKFNN